MSRTWANGGPPFLNAANLNALEADITTALGVPDTALAGRINDPASATQAALNATYAPVSVSTSKADKSTTVTAGTGLTGGGDLSANRTLTVAYGTASGTAAQGNDSRITGAAQAANNLSDLASAPTSRTNLGLGDSATHAASDFAPRLARAAAKTTNYTASANESVLCDASAGTFTITLPTNPADKTIVSVEKIDSVNIVPVVTGSTSDVLYQAGSGVYQTSVDVPNQALTIQFDSATRVWRILNNFLPLTEMDKRYAPLVGGPKQSVRVCAVTNVTLTAPGAVIDNVTLNNGDRILLTAQTNAPDNGVYVFAGAASTLTRSSDLTTAANIVGAIVYINEGTLQQGHGWRNTNYTTMVVGTTAQTWAEFYATPVVTAQLGMPVAYKPSNYYWFNSTGGTTAVTASADRPNASPVFIFAPLTITAMVVEVRTIGDASSVFRFGIWKDDGYGEPGSLFYDGGTISTGGTTGVKVKSLPSNIVIPPGLYWVGGAAQIVTTAPQLGGIAPGSIITPFPLGTTSPGTTQSAGGVNAATQSGAFTDWTLNAVSGSVPRIGFLVPA